MPFVVAVLVGVLCGLLRGGGFTRLAALHFSCVWLLLVAVIAWLFAGPLPLQSWLGSSSFAPLLQVGAHALLVAYIWYNRRIRWLPLVGLGLLANLAAMAANGGQIPVEPSLLKALAAEQPSVAMPAAGVWLHYRESTPDTPLGFLGDIIYLSPPFPWPRIFSPGDVLIVLGIVLVVQTAMLQRGIARWHGSCQTA